MVFQYTQLLCAALYPWDFHRLSGPLAPNPLGERKPQNLYLASVWHPIPKLPTHPKGPPWKEVHGGSEMVLPWASPMAPLLLSPCGDKCPHMDGVLGVTQKEVTNL